MSKGLDLDSATEEQVKAEIKRLQNAVDKGMVWPKQIDIYFHRDKESNYHLADELGLSEQATTNFRYCGYEVEVSVEVHKDGTVYATHFQGEALSNKVKI